MKKILYADKEKVKGLSVERNEFRGKYYTHISINLYDPDSNDWYRIKGLSVSDDYVDYIIEGLQLVSEQIAKEELPDVRQLSFDFMNKGNR